MWRGSRIRFSLSNRFEGSSSWTKSRGGRTSSLPWGIADRPRTPGRFLLLGSASPALLRQSSESLAGRVAHYDCPATWPVGPGAQSPVVSRWPPPVVRSAERGRQLSLADDFVHTFLARDLAGLGISIPGATMERFWAMLAHYHGQVWNGNSRGLRRLAQRGRRYLEALESVFMVRNLGHGAPTSRSARFAEIYLATPASSTGWTSGSRELERHPKIGASWEGFVIEGDAGAARPADVLLFLGDPRRRGAGPLVERGGQLRGFHKAHIGDPA